MPPSAMQFAYARGRPDFLGVQASYGHREVGCVFCALEGSGRVLLENDQQQAEQSLSADL